MNLTALQHSAFLQSLGWAIANSLWQGAVLWVVYYFINALHKNASAKFKNNFSSVLLLTAFIWFCVTLFIKYFGLTNSVSSNSSFQVPVNSVAVTSSTNNFWNIFLTGLSQALPYLSVAYLLLLFLFSAKLINSYRFTYFIKTNGLQKPGAEWKIFTQKVAMHLGIAKKIKLWVSQHIDVPATIGFIKPVILIPLASVNQLSAEQLEAIILHELSHIKRNDYILNLFISLIETVLFFNPFIQLLGKIIKRERENCCDDFVIQYQYDRHSYASALLSLEQSRKTSLRLALAATSGKNQLLVRIKRIMEVKGSSVNFNYGQKLLALLLTTGIICSIAWLSPQKTDNTFSDVNKTIEKFYKPIKTQAAFKKQEDKIKIISIINPSKQVFNKTSARENSGEKVKEPLTQKINSQVFQMAPPPPQPIAAPVSENFSMDEDNAPDVYATSKNVIIKKDLLEKLKAEIEKQGSQFHLNFDWNKMQKDLNEEMKNIQLQNLSSQNFQYYFNQGLENLVQNSIKNVDQNNLNKIAQQYFRQLPQVKIIGSNRRSLDSSSQKVIILNRRRKFLPAENMGRIKIMSEQKNIVKNNSAEGFSFHMNLDNLPSDKKVNSDGRTSRNNNLTIEYKNGVLVINGEKIHLPDNKKILAQLRSQKLIPQDDVNVSDKGTDD